MVAVWQTEQSLRCKSCGTFGWEWDENADSWHADHDTCEGCRRVAVHVQKIRMTPTADEHAGVQVRLYRTPRKED